MRVAVTGTTGRVGAALCKHLAAQHEIIPLSRHDLDLSDPDSIDAAWHRLDCDVFINPAGITSLEACEDAPDLAYQVNCMAPARLAHLAADREVKLIHFSTDYVFDGKLAGKRHEGDPASPLSIYGTTKRAGESAVLAFPRHTVVRVSWVFGPEKRSFIDQIFSSAQTGEPLQAIADKFSFPTYTEDLSGWIDAIISSDATGLIHACQSGEPASWHDLAAIAVEEMANSGCIPQVPEIKRQELSAMVSFRASRPRHTAMETEKLTRILGHSTRSWQETVREYVRHLAQS